MYLYEYLSGPKPNAVGAASRVGGFSEAWNEDMNRLLKGLCSFKKLWSADQKTSLDHINWIAQVIAHAIDGDFTPLRTHDLSSTRDALSKELTSNTFFTNSRYNQDDLNALVRGIEIAINTRSGNAMLFKTRCTRHVRSKLSTTPIDYFVMKWLVLVRATRARLSFLLHRRLSLLGVLKGTPLLPMDDVNDKISWFAACKSLTNLRSQVVASTSHLFTVRGALLLGRPATSTATA